MTKKQLQTIAGRLSRAFSGFDAAGVLVYRVPLGDVVRGVCLEGSGFDRDVFFAWAFFQPVCVPADAPLLNLGFRVKTPDGTERWKNDAASLTSLEAAVRTQALPLVDRVSTAGGAAHEAFAVAERTGDPYALQAAAYLFAASGEVSRARETLVRLNRVLDGSAGWHRILRDRAGLLTQALGSGGGAQLLSAWRAETARNLRLTLDH